MCIPFGYYSPVLLLRLTRLPPIVKQSDNIGPPSIGLPAAGSTRKLVDPVGPVDQATAPEVDEFALPELW